MNMRLAAGQRRKPDEHAPGCWAAERPANPPASLARVAAGDAADCPAVEQALAQLEAQGWMLRGPVQRIWAGERDRAALVAGLDAQGTAVVERALALIGASARRPRGLWSRLAGWLRGGR